MICCMRAQAPRISSVKVYSGNNMATNELVLDVEVRCRTGLPADAAPNRPLSPTGSAHATRTACASAACHATRARTCWPGAAESIEHSLMHTLSTEQLQRDEASRSRRVCRWRLRCRQLVQRISCAHAHLPQSCVLNLRCVVWRGAQFPGRLGRGRVLQGIPRRRQELSRTGCA